MSIRLAAILLLGVSGTCLGDAPPLPTPPETSVVPLTPVERRPALPATERRSAVPAAATDLPASGPKVVSGAPAAWIVPAGPAEWGSWYWPEAVVPGTNAGLHWRYPYYSYRRPWYPAGPASVNVTIVW